MDYKFMWRALQLAKYGEGHVSPNPMVGAVITAGGRIIGEGYHRKFGGPHAEVNAIRSVKLNDIPLLKESEIYVTLEPCSHYGKTPPCADLIIKTGIPEVIIGSLDPNPVVAGNGVRRLEDAGVHVISGILEKECRELNRRFFKAHTSARPWIILKWAQSADGYMARKEKNGNLRPVKFSNPLSSVWMHRERAQIDAITVGKNTREIDNPLLNVRFWGGNSPQNIIIDGHIDCRDFVEELRAKGVTSLMVEGGPTLLKSFIQDNLYDEIRIETSPVVLGCGLEAPDLPSGLSLIESWQCRQNNISIFRS